MRKNLFGESPYAHALLAFTGSADAKGEAVGLALYFFNYSTWTGKPGLYVSIAIAMERETPRTLIPSCDQLEDLYVKQDQRSLGVGKALFRELGRVAEDKVSPATSAKGTRYLHRVRAAPEWIGLS